MESSDITSLELGYLRNATDNIQTQLNGKANIDHTHEIADINGLDGATLNNMMLYYKFIHSAQNTLTGIQLTIPETDFNHIYQWSLSTSTAGLIVLPNAWFNSYGEAMQTYCGWDIKIIINNGTTSAKQISFNTMNPNVDINLVRSTDTFTVPTGGLLYVTLRFGNRFMFVEYNLQDLLS